MRLVSICQRVDLKVKIKSTRPSMMNLAKPLQSSLVPYSRYCAATSPRELSRVTVIKGLSTLWET